MTDIAAPLIAYIADGRCITEAEAAAIIDALRVPATAVRDDVAEMDRVFIGDGEYVRWSSAVAAVQAAKARAEAQAAELARLTAVLENEAHEFSERHEVSGFYVARRIRAALTHPTGD